MNKYIVLVKDSGIVVKFLASEIPVVKRGSFGVYGTKCKQDEKVVSAFVIEEKE